MSAHTFVVILAALLADAVIGDPAVKFHPVRLVGNLARYLEGIVGRWLGRTHASGAIGVLVLTALVLLIVVAPYILLEHILIGQTRILATIYSVLVLSFSFAQAALHSAATKVHRALLRGNIPRGRILVSHIVTRSTSTMNTSELVKTCCESISENFLDSVSAPIMWMALGGCLAGVPGMLVAAWTYRCINTLDAMWGYKNTQYREFGWAAARLDDVLNYVPARITAVLLVLSAFFQPGLSGYQALGVCGRDGRKSRSPNSGWVEAATAGAIQLEFGGPASYHGLEISNPRIGSCMAHAEKPEPMQIIRAIKLNRGATVLLVYFILALVLVVASLPQ